MHPPNNPPEITAAKAARRKTRPDEWAALSVQNNEAGQSYRPCNGAEGECFYHVWCADCVHETGIEDAVDDACCGECGGCPILADTYGLQENDSRYPKAWIIDSSGQPCCTAHRTRAEAAAAENEKTRRELEAAGQETLL